MHNYLRFVYIQNVLNIFESIQINLALISSQSKFISLDLEKSGMYVADQNQILTAIPISIQR